MSRSSVDHASYNGEALMRSRAFLPSLALGYLLAGFGAGGSGDVTGATVSAGAVLS
jgi:hypothetical protein